MCYCHQPAKGVKQGGTSKQFFLSWHNSSMLSLHRLLQPFNVLVPPWSDGVFSLVTAAMRAETDIQTPFDIQRFLVFRDYWKNGGQINFHARLGPNTSQVLVQETWPTFREEWPGVPGRTCGHWGLTATLDLDKESNWPWVDTGFPGVLHLLHPLPKRHGTL